MSDRRRPTSAFLHERDRLAAAVYRACADGRIKDLHKLQKQFIRANDAYIARKKEDDEIAFKKAEARRLREEARERRRLEKLAKQEKRKHKP